MNSKSDVKDKKIRNFIHIIHYHCHALTTMIDDDECNSWSLSMNDLVHYPWLSTFLTKIRMFIFVWTGNNWLIQLYTVWVARQKVAFSFPERCTTPGWNPLIILPSPSPLCHDNQKALLPKKCHYNCGFKTWTILVTTQLSNRKQRWTPSSIIITGQKFSIRSVILTRNLSKYMVNSVGTSPKKFPHFFQPRRRPSLRSGPAA